MLERQRNGFSGGSKRAKDNPLSIDVRSCGADADRYFALRVFDQGRVARR